MTDPTTDVDVIVMEHHDPEEALADLPLSVETVLQLSVEQLREKLLELDINPKGRSKPQLQLELLQVLKYEVVAPEGKPTSLDQEQSQLRKETFEAEQQQRKEALAAEQQQRKDAFEIEMRRDALEQQRRREDFEQQERERRELLDMQLRRELAEAKASLRCC